MTFEVIVDPDDFAIDPDACVAFQMIGLQLLLHRPSFVQMDGSHHDEAGATGELEHLLNDILGGVLLNLLAADGAKRAPYARVKQTEILVYLRRSAHRRTGVAGYYLLFDGDGGRDAADEVALGLVHAPQELAGVTGERLHITALTFGIQGVEGQR